MVAIYDPENTLNIKEMAESLKKSLPSYARPLFVRVLSELPMTGKFLNIIIYIPVNLGCLDFSRFTAKFFTSVGTFKLKKKDLQRDGFDIKKVSF